MLRILSCVTLAAFVGVLPVADQPGDLLKQADRAFAQKTYSRALELYGRAAKAPEFKKSLDRIRLRTGVCLGRLSRQDEALTVFRQLAREKPGTLTAARGLVEGGVLSLSMPHYYYEKSGKKHRGKWIQGGTYRWTGTEDVKTGLRDLESAGRILEGLVAKGLAATERGREFSGLLGLHLRCFLEWAAGIEQKRHENGGLVPKALIVAADAFGKLESWNERLAYLHDRAIDVQARGGKRAGRCLAGYMKGMAFRRVLRGLDGVVRQQEFQVRYHPRDRKEGVLVALPEEWNPIKILQKTLLASKGLKLADDILFGLAKVQQEQGFYVDAAANYRKLEDQHPKSIWVQDSQHQVEQITFPRISVEVGKTQPAGKRVEAGLATRNVPEVTVEIFKFPYRWIFENDRVIHDADLQMSDTARIVKRLRTSPASGGRVASFKHKTPDRKRHKHQNEKVLLPHLEKGCYLVQASGNGVTYRDLLLVSDLGLIRHVDGEKVLVFVTDVVSGKPVAGADVVVRERLWGTWTFGRGWQVRVKRGKTGPDGTWSSQRAWTERRGRVQIDIGTWKGSAAALTPQFSYRTPRSASTSTRVHVFSDRPVYRPGDSIRFSAVLREESNERYTNLPGEQVTVRVRNPKGTYIFDQVMKTDESGALDQAIVLGEEPPLGRYRIEVRQGKRTLGSGSLRVEEYKKPEFEVTVKPPKEQLRLGTAAAVTLEGRYYFGAPVAAGKVEYRIFRERFRARFHRNEPFRYLYGSIPRDVDPSDRGRGRELVTRGKGQLDENGRLRVEWQTDKWAALTPPCDSVFIVQADVTDSSRRTISGAGRIPVTRTAFQANLTADRGFYLRGETVSLEIQTQTAAGVALASRGKFRVYRVSQRNDEKDKVIDVLTQVLEEDASTNDQGTGFHRWTCDEAGRFVLSYQASDSWGEIVRTDIPIWVQAPGYRALDFELKNLRVRTDKRVYQPGETAKVLVTSNFPDSSVLLCLTAGYRTLEHRVVQLEGKALAIELPITKVMTPNVFIQAFCTRDGGFYAVHHELLVPPVDRLLNVSLAFDKSEYKPGEKGAVTVSVKDNKGRPVAARVALTTYDASLLYIQQDQVPDIRKHFYGNRRSRNTSGGASHRFGFQGYLSADVSWGRYETRGNPPLWRSQNSGLVSKILDGRGFGRIDKLLDDLPNESIDEETEEQSGDMDLDGFAPKRNARRGRRSLGSRAEGSDKAGAPASSRAPMKEELKSKKSRPRGGKWSKDAGDDSREAGAGADEPVVRTDFRDTAVWAPDVLCGADGQASVEIPFPESLTRWHTRALAWTGDTRVGEGAADTVTTKDLLVRLQAPRFFVEGDRIVVSGIVNNRTEKDVECEVSITVAGDTLSIKDQPTRKVTVRAQADLALDWWTEVVGDGTATVTVKVKSEGDGDAMRLSFPVMLWGATKTLTGTDILTDAGESKLDFDLPRARNVNATRLKVTLQPSLAATMLDALPYLIAYPYGCTEQTTSRFIPAVATSLTLKEMGTSLEAIASQRRALAQAGKLAIREAVLSDRRLNDIVQAGIRRLSSMQHGDGGFGWWKADKSSPYLTAYVLSGLLLAKEGDCGVPERMIKRSLAFLEKETPKLDNLNTATFASLVLARAGKAPMEVLQKIYINRDDLSPYGRALLASALAAGSDKSRARIVVDNLTDSAQEDKDNGTVHWEGGHRRWRWWNNSIETNAAMLQALLDVNPKHRFVAPLVKWLVTNRKGNRWTNTRDTATCVLALCRYAQVSGELDPDYTLTIALGPTTKSFKVTSANMFAFDNVFELKGDALETGMNRVKITKAGKGRAYVTARMSFFTKEDEIKGAGHELLVARRYFRIEEKPVTTEENGRKVTKLVSNRFPLVPGAQVDSGTIVEVELEVTAKNDFEYLLFEDMKPAGFEPLQLRSGRSYDRGICSNTEFRDERTAFFVTWLTQGTHKLSYKLRAEIPGTLRALPARGQCMYSPEYGGITDSFKIQVTEGKGN